MKRRNFLGFLAGLPVLAVKPEPVLTPFQVLPAGFAYKWASGEPREVGIAIIGGNGNYEIYGNVVMGYYAGIEVK